MPRGHTPPSSLHDALADALPKDHTFHFYHISTPPTRCLPLYSPPQGAKPQRTYCEKHFLNVSTIPSGNDEELLIYAIEVLIYTTRQLTTVFVSKADSTGYLALLKLPRSYNSPLRSITTTFLAWLVQQRRRPDKRLVLSLFARAQDQYLFPGSVENQSKHVSTDRGLISWWCRVVDPLLHVAVPATSSQDGEIEQKDTSCAYLVVPGADSNTPFLPASVRLDPTQRRRWKQGHPLYDIAPIPSAPPRCLVPHFPDDPKSRFVDELDAELPDNASVGASESQTESPSKRGNGMWKSVRSLEQFWEFMAFRQECASGRLVGFLWIVFEPSSPVLSSQDLLESQSSTTSTALHADTRASPSPLGGDKLRALQAKKSEKKPLSGPIIPRPPRIKSSASDVSSATQPSSSPYYTWPPDSRGSIVLSDKDYKRVTDLLLKLDFANREIAAVGTKQWVQEVGVYADDPRWGFAITGRREPALTTETGGSREAATVLSVKRKAKTAVSGDESSLQAEQAGPNVLQSGLIRKKAKIQP